MSSADHESESAGSELSSSKTSIFATAFLIAVVLLGTSSLEFYSSALPVNPSGSRPASFSTSISSLGLQLSVFLNATAIRRYSALGVHMEVLNTLDRNVSAFPGQLNADISDWNSYDFICSINIAESLLGFALFKGNYSPANISMAGSPLQLAPFVSTACPAFPYPQETIFKPLSHMLATLDGPRAGISLNVTSEQCVSLPPSLHECGPAHGLFGYWNTRGFLSPDAATFRSPYFQYLVPGVYTLVVADAWGQALYAHFDVL